MPLRIVQGEKPAKKKSATKKLGEDMKKAYDPKRVGKDLKKAYDPKSVKPLFQGLKKGGRVKK